MTLYDHFLAAHGRVCTDTRHLEPGAIFFALRGPNFNGNRYALDALAAGAALCVVDDPALGTGPGLFQVADVLAALQALAHQHRSTLGIPVVGIAGSNGKTTTKELVAAVLGRMFRTVATAGNLNNHIGVPLTLLRLTRDTEIAVVEMGANRLGEVGELCQICAPSHAIVTSIGKEHLEGFGSMQGIIFTEGQVYDYVAEHGGMAFVPIDDPTLVARAVANPTVTYYGASPGAHIQGQVLRESPQLHFCWAEGNTPLATSALANAPHVPTHLFGAYNLANLLCAAAVGRHFGVPAAAIDEALSGYVPQNKRSQIAAYGTNTVIIDCYNANPASMRVALEALHRWQTPHKIAILGDMLELGADSADEHYSLLEWAATLGLENVFAVGPLFADAAHRLGMPHYATVSALQAAFPLRACQHAAVLLKGSRGIGMEAWLDT